MALSDIRTKVADNLNRDDIPDETGGRIDDWINDAKRVICRTHNFAFMETEITASTVDEQQAYSLPDGTNALRFKSEISCELINADACRVPLIKKNKQDLEDMRRYRDTEGYGTPRYYAIQYGQIHLFPAPDHGANNDTAWTLNLEYYGYLDDLSEDTDTDDLIDGFPEVVEALATARGFRFSHEYDKAAQWKADAMAMIFDMVKEDVVMKYGTLEEGMEPRAGSGTYPRTRTW